MVVPFLRQLQQCPLHPAQGSCRLLQLHPRRAAGLLQGLPGKVGCRHTAQIDAQKNTKLPAIPQGHSHRRTHCRGPQPPPGGRHRGTFQQEGHAQACRHSGDPSCFQGQTQEYGSRNTGAPGPRQKAGQRYGLQRHQPPDCQRADAPIGQGLPGPAEQKEQGPGSPAPQGLDHPGQHRQPQQRPRQGRDHHTAGCQRKKIRLFPQPQGNSKQKGQGRPDDALPSGPEKGVAQGRPQAGRQAFPPRTHRRQHRRRRHRALLPVNGADDQRASAVQHPLSCPPESRLHGQRVQSPFPLEEDPRYHHSYSPFLFCREMVT